MSKTRTSTQAEPTFSPAALQEIVSKAVAEARTSTAVLEEMQVAKTPGAWATGKSEQSIKNELQTIRAFKRAGFGDVKPRVDVLTFNLWIAKGYRPIKGSRSLKVGNLRLFHKSQVAPLSAEERAAMKEQRAAAVRRCEAKVITMTSDASPQ